MLENYLAMDLMNLMVLAILSYMVSRNEGIVKGGKAAHLWALLATATVVLIEMGIVLYESATLIPRALYVAFNAGGFALAPLIPLLLAPVFGAGMRRGKALVLIPFAINAVLALSSPWSGFIFSISAGGEYQRGNLFYVFIAAYAWGILALLHSILEAGKRYRYRLRVKLMAMFAFLLMGTTAQIAFPDVHTTWTCITMGLALHYGLVCEFQGALDALTGLYNRKSYESEVLRLGKKRFAALVMDVDDFKRVNDMHGHMYGDECLKILAALVYETFRDLGVSYRIGGDEFCVLMRSVDEERIASAIKTLTAKLMACRAEDPMLPELSYGLKVCGGGTDAYEILRAADRQMYAHKERRKAARAAGDAGKATLADEP
jgi:diguanylate cyclase (GGDEF)-like protein